MRLLTIGVWLAYLIACAESAADCENPIAPNPEVVRDLFVYPKPIDLKLNEHSDSKKLAREFRHLGDIQFAASYSNTEVSTAFIYTFVLPGNSILTEDQINKVRELESNSTPALQGSPAAAELARMKARIVRLSDGRIGIHLPLAFGPNGYAHMTAIPTVNGTHDFAVVVGRDSQNGTPPDEVIEVPVNPNKYGPDVVRTLEMHVCGRI